MATAASNRDVLRGAKVAFTGRFATMTQAELADVVRDFGGRTVSAPNRHTKFLVVGQEGLPLEVDGQPTVHLKKARQLEGKGFPIEIIGEAAFLNHLGLTHRRDMVQRHYTALELSRILGVPGDRIRKWVGLGLIQPVAIIHRVGLFDFRQAACAKAICEFADVGLPASRIRCGLEQLKQLLPDSDSPLSQISLLEDSSRMVVRLENGRLAEPSGQLQLDFEAPETHEDFEPTIGFRSGEGKSTDAWFEEAVASEDAGRFPEAEDAYRAAIASDRDDPILRFNLGNVLYRLDRIEDATEQFRQAVLLNAAYVEAWNNLGSVLLQLGEAEDSAAAFRKALSLAPGYADAHYNLAEALLQLGRRDEARNHWRRYLKFDPSSPWADEARQKIRDSQPASGARANRGG